MVLSIAIMNAGCTAPTRNSVENSGHTADGITTFISPSAGALCSQSTPASTPAMSSASYPGAKRCNGPRQPITTAKQIAVTNTASKLAWAMVNGSACRAPLTPPLTFATPIAGAT